MMKKQNIAIFGCVALLVGGALLFTLRQSGGTSRNPVAGPETKEGGVSALVARPDRSELPERFREAVHAMEAKWRKNRRSSTRSSYPPRDREDRGLFNAEGLRDVFQDTVGTPMPDYVTPLAGKYGVWQYTHGDTDNFNATVYAYYAVEPEDVERLRQDVLASWRDRFADQPIDVLEGTQGGESQYGGFMFPTGCKYAQVYQRERESRLKEHSYSIVLNGENGLVHLSSFRGREE